MARRANSPFSAALLFVSEKVPDKGLQADTGAMDKIEQTAIRLLPMIEYYWTLGASDQEASVTALQKALRDNDRNELLDVMDAIRTLASYYWSNGNSGQVAMLEELNGLLREKV